jgi:uncharacterized protein YdbL (DUF1318 family)
VVSPEAMVWTQEGWKYPKGVITSGRWFGHYYRGWLGPCVTSEAPAVFLNEINTSRTIKAMVSMAKQNGIQVILATIPPGAAQILKARSPSGQTDRR